MSLFTLGGTDLTFCSTLRQQLTVVSSINIRDHCCFRCSSRKLEKCLWIDETLRDTSFICRSCANKHKEEGMSINIELVMELLQVLNGLTMEEEGTSLIQVLIKTIRRSGRIKKQQKDQIIGHIKEQLLGWEFKQLHDVCQKTQHRLSSLLKQFMDDLKSSFPARLYQAIRRMPFKLQAGFIPLFKRVIFEQKAFKLDIIKRMTSSIANATQFQEIKRWMGRGIAAITKSQYSFGVNASNKKNILYSICRSYVQYRYIYEQNSEGIEKVVNREVVIGLLPFANEAVTFKVNTDGSTDEIDIGIFFGKRTALELKSGHSPILFRFLIEPRPVIRHLRSSSEHRIRLIQTSKIQNPKSQRNSKRQLFFAMDQDQISLYFDYIRQTFRIVNKTQRSEYISMPVKYLSRQFYVYPCVSLVGVKVMVQFMANK